MNIENRSIFRKVLNRKGGWGSLFRTNSYFWEASLSLIKYLGFVIPHLTPAGKRSKLGMPGASVDKHPWGEARLSKELLYWGLFQLNWHFGAGWHWRRCLCCHHWTSWLTNLFLLINLFWRGRGGLAPKSVEVSDDFVFNWVEPQVFSITWHL